jgi:hypothetical protein
MRPGAYFILTPDDFTRQGESAATQWVNIRQITMLFICLYKHINFYLAVKFGIAKMLLLNLKNSLIIHEENTKEMNV